MKVKLALTKDGRLYWHQITIEEGKYAQTIQRELTLFVLGICGGNRTHAARHLGVHLRTLRNHLHEYEAQGYKIPGYKYVWENSCPTKENPTKEEKTEEDSSHSGET